MCTSACQNKQRELAFCIGLLHILTDRLVRNKNRLFACWHHPPPLTHSRDLHALLALAIVSVAQKSTFFALQKVAHWHSTLFCEDNNIILYCPCSKVDFRSPKVNIIFVKSKDNNSHIYTKKCVTSYSTNAARNIPRHWMMMGRVL